MKKTVLILIILSLITVSAYSEKRWCSEAVYHTSSGKSGVQIDSMYWTIPPENPGRWTTSKSIAISADDMKRYGHTPVVIIDEYKHFFISPDGFSWRIEWIDELTREFLIVIVSYQQITVFKDNGMAVSTAINIVNQLDRSGVLSEFSSKIRQTFGEF